MSLVLHAVGTVFQNTMTKRYYSSRNKPKKLTHLELYERLQHLYLLFRDRDYFKKGAGITKDDLPDHIQHEAAIAIGFQPFPISEWEQREITEDHIFDVIEFLHDHVAKPGEWVGMTNGTGYYYYDYVGYDGPAGQEEFRKFVNSFLCDYKDGFELTKDGMILARGTRGLQDILGAEIVPYDEKNVDNRVRDAILKYRNRRLDLGERRQAVRELADVFEWLKKTGKLDKVLSKKDEAALFEIANNFQIRHHNPKQKTEYDQSIWYSWMFHFYLATYHATIRLLKKYDSAEGPGSRTIRRD